MRNLCARTGKEGKRQRRKEGGREGGRKGGREHWTYVFHDNKNICGCVDHLIQPNDVRVRTHF